MRRKNDYPRLRNKNGIATNDYTVFVREVLVHELLYVKRTIILPIEHICSGYLAAFRRILSMDFPFASSSISLSRQRILCMRGSWISSTWTPQITPLI